MDCVEGMRLLPDECIDLTVTSPPYDNLRTYNGYSFDFEQTAKELFRITKEGGVVVWVVGDETKDFCESLTSFKQAIYFVEKCGFKLLDTMIYKKNGAPATYPSLRRYGNLFEYMFVLSKGRPKTFNPLKDRPNKYYGKLNSGNTARQKDGSTKSTGSYIPNKFGMRFNIWEYNVGRNKDTSDKVAFKHPARFPELLAKDHILSWSNEGDIILDPFTGSGTTAKMALLNHRHFIGFEVSSEYVAIANQRIESVTCDD
ncbi:MAG: site-specific DNA-methyltransferase [Acidobacterium ailaaui]|nr:site-specific DNA-methyltransferase [Pseudacidobacterium ailaaui]